MTVDWQTLFNLLGGVVVAVFGWVMHAMYDAIKDLHAQDGVLHKRITDLGKELPDTYVRRDDFREFTGRVEIQLQRILDKLEEKADKP